MRAGNRRRAGSAGRPLHDPPAGCTRKRIGGGQGRRLCTPAPCAWAIAAFSSAAARASGKSSLVLALLFGADDTVLIADDQVSLSCHGGRLMAAAPASLRRPPGSARCRHRTRPYVSPASIDLVVDLKPLADCPRLPGEGGRWMTSPVRRCAVSLLLRARPTALPHSRRARLGASVSSIDIYSKSMKDRSLLRCGISW